MKKQKINIVWLKRDLRTQDHAALHAAEQAGIPYLIVYLFEPSILSHADTSLRHVQFCYHSILGMNKNLGVFNREVITCYSEALEVFSYFQEHYSVQQLFSYQESGIQITWNRDKEVLRFCKRNNILWTEFQRDGIIRGIKNRDGWDKRWFAVMHEPIIQNRYSKQKLEPINHPFPIPETLQPKLSNYPPQFQPAGEQFAWKYLHSFVEDRGKRYHLDISKPLDSRKSCGRISPYLAWGNLSIRQAYQFVKNHENYAENKRAFGGLITRLRWHCHFIQKFEVECSYEHTCLNRGYEFLEHEQKKDFIKAWETGHTGYPLVDACMRALQETGWINFRMRAMLVSFFCHNLDQDWGDGVYHLARLFLDYEPGIHYTQFQMQAGTTGINTIRMYNPVKQSKEKDPKATFILRYVPELADVPTAFIHEPYLLTPMDLTNSSFVLGETYPLPIVNITESGKRARAKIWGHRKHPLVQQEKERIVRLHTRNNRKSKTKK